jgi:hypothetical protein
MGRRAKEPQVAVLPVSSKKQLLTATGVCTFLGGISHDSLLRLRNDPSERFPQPLQILGGTPLWSVEQLERYVGRKEKEVESIGA